MVARTSAPHLTLIPAGVPSPSDDEERRRLSGIAQLLRDIYAARAGTYVQRHRGGGMTAKRARPRHLRLLTGAADERRDALNGANLPAFPDRRNVG